LHADRKGHLEMVVTMLLPVDDRPVGEEGGVAAAAGLQQGPITLDIQEGFLLAGKTGLRQILGGGTGAHRHRRGPQRCIGSQDRLLQLWRQVRLEHQAAGLKPSVLQGLKIAGIQLGQQPLEGRHQLVGR
jgi:hypothetical protein